MPETFFIAGPTAVGKTAIAVATAEMLDAEIVGCDAYQIYQELPILTAQPDAEARRNVPHHLVGFLSVSNEYDVGKYLNHATAVIASIHSKGKNALVVGGAGMYMRAITRGLSELPPPDPQLREELNQLPLAELCRRLSDLDPLGFRTIDANNPRRVSRAVEICLLTGRPYSAFRTEWVDAPVKSKGVLLARPREELIHRIFERTATMFNEEVIKEVAQCENVGPTARQTLGFSQINDVLLGLSTVEQATRDISIATRQYAKRQVTWFRSEPWMAAVPLERDQPVVEVANHITDILRRATR